MPKKEDYLLAFVRIGLGWTFLWAFFDKLLGLGFATEAGKSWLAGGSPTFGFLKFGADSMFKGLFQSLAGIALIDWIFMLGLLCLGIALILGVASKLAGYSGAVLMILMWLALVPPENNPILVSCGPCKSVDVADA